MAYAEHAPDPRLRSWVKCFWTIQDEASDEVQEPVHLPVENSSPAQNAEFSKHKLVQINFVIHAGQLESYPHRVLRLVSNQVLGCEEFQYFGDCQAVPQAGRENPLAHGGDWFASSSGIPPSEMFAIRWMGCGVDWYFWNESIKPAAR
jgi:hypothetical protein